MDQLGREISYRLGNWAVADGDVTAHYDHTVKASLLQLEL